MWASGSIENYPFPNSSVAFALDALTLSACSVYFNSTLPPCSLEASGDFSGYCFKDSSFPRLASAFEANSRCNPKIIKPIKNPTKGIIRPNNKLLVTGLVVIFLSISHFLFFPAAFSAYLDNKSTSYGSIIFFVVR